MIRGPDDEARLARVRLLARVLDDQFQIPGTPYRIGLDPLIGLVPGIGDALSAILSTLVLVTAARIGAPTTLLARMGLNIAIDSIVGVVPLLGDVFDAGYKTNVRNLRLLEGWIERPGPTRRASRAIVGAIVVAALLALAAMTYAGWQLFAWVLRGAGT